MGAKLGGHDDEPIAEINVVPLVDIILVVLIIFMVTAPMIMKPNIEVQLPKAASGTDSKPSLLSVTVQKEGRILVNGKETPVEQVQSQVEDLLVSEPDLQAIIAADQDVPHGKVIEVIDKIKLAGVVKFAISVEKSK